MTDYFGGDPYATSPGNPYYQQNLALMQLRNGGPAVAAPTGPGKVPVPQPAQAYGPAASAPTSYGPGVGYAPGVPGAFPSGLNNRGPASAPKGPPPQPSYDVLSSANPGDVGPQVPVSNDDPNAAAAAAGGGSGGGSHSAFSPATGNLLATIGGALLGPGLLRDRLGVVGQVLPGALREANASNATIDFLRSQGANNPAAAAYLNNPKFQAMLAANPQLAQSLLQAQLTPHPLQLHENYTTGEEQIFDPLTGRIAPVAGSGGGGMSDKAIDIIADRVLAGDTSALTNIGRGAQGARDIRKIQDRVAQKANERGLSGADIAQGNAEFQGTKASERAIGTRSAQVMIANKEALQFADLALETSANVPRGSFVPWNQMELAWKSNTSDPATAKFTAATNSFINAYSRAVSPTGVPSVSAQEHAREMLNKAQSQEAYAATIEFLKREMAAALAAPAEAKQQLRDQNQPAAASADVGAAAAGGGSGGGVVDWRTFFGQ